MSVPIGALQRQLWRDMLASGALANPSPAIAAAFFAVPRHRFIDRFRTWTDPTWRAAEPADVYHDEAIILATGDGGIASTCSQPSYILALAEWLDILPGQTVLEIGSGCGWLAAILAHLTGPDGFVTGVEILPDLAKASRQKLADLDNVQIITGDGATGYAACAPYDRVICTAGMPEVSSELIRQTLPGARLLLPMSTGKATECSVRLFERVTDGLEQIGERPGFFVPMAALPNKASRLSNLG